MKEIFCCERLNSDCCHYIQITYLQGRYDRMVDESKKTGNAYYFEPLRHELNDTFGVMKNITPDSVFSNLKGLQVNPNSDNSNDADETASEEPQLVTPQNNDDSKEKKKNSKSMLKLLILSNSYHINKRIEFQLYHYIT